MNSPSPIDFAEHGAWCVAQCREPSLSDLALLDRLEADCRRVLGERKPRYLAMDMAGVNFVVTRVLSTMLMLHKRQREAGGCFALCSIDANVLRVLRLTRLDRVFEIYPDLQALLTDRPDGPPRAAPTPGLGP